MKHILEYYKWDLDKVRGPKVTPNKYVYHITKSANRMNIYSNGLEPRVGESYSDHAKTEDAVPAIFATMVQSDDIWDDLRLKPEMMEGYDIWQINTFKCDNEWYKDNHFEDMLDRNPHIVTFTKIPRTALRCFYANK